MSLICYDPEGNVINPYDICPICDDLYKDCPHMKTNFKENLMKSGFKELKVGEFSTFYRGKLTKNKKAEMIKEVMMHEEGFL